MSELGVALEACGRAGVHFFPTRFAATADSGTACLHALDGMALEHRRAVIRCLAVGIAENEQKNKKTRCSADAPQFSFASMKDPKSPWHAAGMAVLGSTEVYFTSTGRMLASLAGVAEVRSNNNLAGVGEFRSNNNLAGVGKVRSNNNLAGVGKFRSWPPLQWAGSWALAV